MRRIVFNPFIEVAEADVLDAELLEQVKLGDRVALTNLLAGQDTG